MTERSSKGLTHVYTGDGKGKTTAALGLAMRAVGQGMKVSFIQFLKGEIAGEHLFISKYHPFDLVQVSVGDAFTRPEEQLSLEARQTLACAEETILGGKYDLVVLDEVFIAVSRGFITTAQVLDLLQRKPEPVELVLTGRRAPPEIVQQADLVTEMLMIKHPFNRGVPGRRGIEF